MWEHFKYINSGRNSEIASIWWSRDTNQWGIVYSKPPWIANKTQSDKTYHMNVIILNIQDTTAKD